MAALQVLGKSALRVFSILWVTRNRTVSVMMVNAMSVNYLWRSIHCSPQPEDTQCGAGEGYLIVWITYCYVNCEMQ
jgi:hypothetical protein